jgi:mono/diheme cytochrome c family protein
MDNEMSFKRASTGTARDHLRGFARKGTWNLVSHYLQPLAKRRGSLLLAASLVSVAALTACGKDNNDGSPSGIRAFIDDQIDGGIEALQVPPTAIAIPVPPDPAGYSGRFTTTEAKRYLGKLLFHDPIRTQRVNLNKGQPLDFPAATAFGGTIGVTNSHDGSPPSYTFANTTSANVQQIAANQLGTGSCGSCHIGEAAGKAGQQLNFNTGGEGRGYTDAAGNFIPRRRPMASLLKLRNQPLFPNDALVDALPTLTDIFLQNGNRVVSTPALFYHQPGLPNPPNFSILQSGRLDQLDSVARQAPSMIGFGFNNRLLFGGFGGEPHTTAGSLQPSSILLNPPFDDPAQENLTFLLLDAHRMLVAQDATLQGIPAFVQAFREAFPSEAQQADQAGDISILINDFNVARATATFLRTVVTRDTPYDKFLAGNDTALTPAQLRGAKLFFTEATDGGANCFACHSGPMLNKQPDDPDLAGIGKFVEENFANVGIGDHPVQALNAQAHGRAPGYHAEDVGRAEVTDKSSDRFKFRALTLRQLKEARTFFHDGSFTSVRAVVAYFNAGIPADPTAGAESTLDSRFTSPRGNGTRGLGLTDAQIDDLTDFLENGLYDPAFKDAFNINADDLNYTNKHSTLKAKGAVDGVLLSGSAMDDDDPLSRRDQGLEFLNVTRQVATTVSTSGNMDTWVITNKSTSVIDTHLLVIVTGLAAGVTVTAPEQTTGQALPGGSSSGEPSGEPYYRLFLPDGVLSPGQSISVNVVRTGGSSGSYRLKVLSGQGKP